MSANVYTIESLLEGTYYRSFARKGKEGIISRATKRDNVWYDGAEAYTVLVRPQYEMGKPSTYGNDFYATVVVKVGD
jgi:hypothetical protein